MRAVSRRLVLGAFLGLTFPSTGALAEQTASGSVSEPPVPRLRIEIEENGPARPWRLDVVNDGLDPAFVVADPRLLWFEVKVPGKRKTETCRLPSGLFPDHPERRMHLVLDPGDRATGSFDPRLYCFSPGGQRQLVPGAQVTPHFGWPQQTKKRWQQGKLVEEKIAEPPYVALPLESEQAYEASDEGPGEKEFVGTTFALDSSYAVWAATKLPSDEKPAPFEMKLMRGSDAHAENSATVQLRLVNRTNRTRYVYFRRELVSFEVMGPRGLVQCDPEPDLRAPDRHSFSLLPPGRSLTVTSRLIELCPRGTFAQPGLYLVHARFETHEDGSDFDLDAYVGRVVSTEAVGVRIRTGDKHTRRLRRVPAGEASPES